LKVYGFGEEKTPEAFRNACHKFVFTEVIRSSMVAEAGPAPAKVARKRRSSRPAKAAASVVEPTAPKPEFPKSFVLTALEKSMGDAEWVPLGTFGSYLTKLQPDFDSRRYGYKKLSDLVKAKTDLFVTEERQPPGSNQKVLYLRAR